MQTYSVSPIHAYTQLLRSTVVNVLTHPVLMYEAMVDRMPLTVKVPFPNSVTPSDRSSSYVLP